MWDRRAARDGTRPFVFCSSLADVFDNQVPKEWRADLFALIRATPNLVWLLLTKRPQNIARMLPNHSIPNVCLGCTIVDQEEAERNLPYLLLTPGGMHRFVSCEPLLGQIDFSRVPLSWPGREPRTIGNALRARDGATRGIDWVIAGGESGPHARPMHPDWARSLRDQCDAAGVPFFFKQWGEYAPAVSDRVDLVMARNGKIDRALPSNMDGGGERPLWCAMARVGKKSAGRVFEGLEHTARPCVEPVQRRAA